MTKFLFIVFILAIALTLSAFTGCGLQVPEIVYLVKCETGATRCQTVAVYGTFDECLKEAANRNKLSVLLTYKYGCAKGKF